MKAGNIIFKLHLFCIGGGIGPGLSPDPRFFAIYYMTMFYVMRPTVWCACDLKLKTLVILYVPYDLARGG
jgi:hypothetical protein